jgi:hypothetical protein
VLGSLQAVNMYSSPEGGLFSLTAFAKREVNPSLLIFAGQSVYSGGKLASEFQPM